MLTPRIGDSFNVSFRAKNILSRMNPAVPTFSVSRYIWNEISTCSHDGKSSCHYAPYIFRMILGVTGLEILTNKPHLLYKSNKGKLEQMLKIDLMLLIPPQLEEFALESHLPPVRL